MIDKAIQFFQNFIQLEYDGWKIATEMPGESYFKEYPSAGRRVLARRKEPTIIKHKEFIENLKALIDDEIPNLNQEILLSRFQISRNRYPDKAWFEKAPKILQDMKKRTLFAVSHHNHPKLNDIFCFYTGGTDINYDYGINTQIIAKLSKENSFKFIKIHSSCICSGLGVYKNETCKECAGFGWLDSRNKVKMKLGKVIETRGIEEPKERKALFNKIVGE